MLRADVSVCAAAAFQPIKKKTVGSKDEQIKCNLLEPEIEVVKPGLLKKKSVGTGTLTI